jgi:formylglycine-generating enzyme required for sulfatase activity
MTKKIFGLPAPAGILLAGALAFALLPGVLTGCPTEADSDPETPKTPDTPDTDTAAPGPVSKVYGYYNKAAGGITLTWTDPADGDLAEIRVSWNGGSAAAAKGAGTYTIAVAEDRTAAPYTIALKAADAAGNEAEAVTLKVKADITRSMIPVPGGTVTSEHAFITWAPPRPITVAPFLIGATEVTYELWHEVYTWATSDERGANKYTFAYFGGEGAATGSSVPSSLAAPTEKKYEPVTSVYWRDAAVWCNAYSEYTGKTPAYYEQGTATVLRTSENAGTARDTGKAEQADLNAAANGYRLPTLAEWEYAARGGSPSLVNTAPWNYLYPGSFTANAVDVAWTSSTTATGGKTHEPAELQPNTLGLYDMGGNVNEWQWVTASGSSYTVYYRGGCWRITAAGTTGGNPELNTQNGLKSLSQYAAAPGGAEYTGYGFRVVCAPEQ